MIMTAIRGIFRRRCGDTVTVSRASVRASLRGGAFPQADPQCIATQHTTNAWVLNN